MRYILVAIFLSVFCAPILAQDIPKPFSEMTYLELLEVDQKTLKKPEKKTFKKSIKAAKKAWKKADRARKKAEKKKGPGRKKNDLKPKKEPEGNAKKKKRVA